MAYPNAGKKNQTSDYKKGFRECLSPIAGSSIFQ